MVAKLLRSFHVSAILFDSRRRPAPPRVDVAKSIIGIALRPGAAKPIFRRADLLGATAIIIPGGAEQELSFGPVPEDEDCRCDQGQAVRRALGASLGVAVARGEGDIGCSFSAGLRKGAPQRNAAKALVTFVTTAPAIPVLKETGLEPGQKNRHCGAPCGKVGANTPREGTVNFKLMRFAIALLASSACVAGAQAQSSYPCNSDGPNPYHLVTNWAQMPRGWDQINAVTVDEKNNFWGVDRCEAAGCKSVFEIGPDGKTLKNFGADLFIEPHQAAVDHDGNLWVADATPKGTKGLQVTKLSPDGRVLLKLGKPGVGLGSAAMDTFDSPTGVAVASNGDIFIAQGHGEKPNNSRILKFTKDGKFIKSWGTYGEGDGQLRSPHAIAVDSGDRVFVGDRTNSRIDIFDKDGKFIAAWKQFGRPSGIAIDKNDMLYVIDSQSSDMPGDRYNPGCKRGIRVGSTKDGKVVAYIPPPPPADPKWQPAIGVAVDRNGNIFAASDDQHNVVKWVKN